MLPASVDYTSKDFDSLKARLESLVKSVFPEWTDFEVAAFGNLLLEMFAFVGDLLTFYQDNQARESRLATATQRKNVINLAKMLGYRLPGAQAATVSLNISLDAVPAARVVIPKGTVARTREVTDPIAFQLLSDAVILAGANPPTVTVDGEHSESHVQYVDTTGLANFEVYLDHTPFLDGSASVSTPQGAFTEAENFLDSGPTDRHFVVLVDQNDRALVRFGNGVNGLPPIGPVTLSYKTGGGSNGIVDAGTVTVIEGAFLADNGTPVRVSVTNPARSSGGTDRQTNEAAKVLAPASLRATERSVAREDFEIHACKLGGIARALMLTSNEDGGILENTGILYIIPQGGGIPTPALKAQALRQVTEVYPCTLTFQPEVHDPSYLAVDVLARVWLKNGVSETVAGATIRAALQAFFAITNADGTPNASIDFGFNLKDEDGEPANQLPWSDLFNVVRDAAGVRKVGSDRSDFLLNGLASDVTLSPRDFPTLGTVTLINGATGSVF